MAPLNSQDEDQRCIVIRRFRDQPDAFLFQSLLDSAEIECYLADENTIRMDWFWSNLLGRIKLCVRKADVDTASSLLSQNVMEKFDVEGLGEYQQPRCSKCLSLQVSFRGLNKPVDYARAVFGGPLSLHSSLWECDSCGQQWPESSDKPPANLLTSISSILLIFIAVETAGFLFLSVWFSLFR